jgi:Na+-translocating ferredoxin:NAD+ oxidoreductase subunit G
MNQFANGSGRFILICAVAALFLGGVNALTEPAIRSRGAADLGMILPETAPGGKIGDPEAVKDGGPVKEVCRVQDAQGRVAGYALRLVAPGYAGDITLLAGLSTTGEIMTVRVLDDQETPDLGKKIEYASYMKKFRGTGAAKPIPLRKAELASADADAVAGATITFCAVGRALEAGSAFAKKLGGRK